MVSQEQFDELRAKLVNQEQFEELRLKLVVTNPSKVQIRLGCNRK